jgi:hypothetical protein
LHSARDEWDEWDDTWDAYQKYRDTSSIELFRKKYSFFVQVPDHDADQYGCNKKPADISNNMS